jgi:hypothetical protein
MLENILDGLKGIGKLLGGLIWGLVVLPWVLSEWLVGLKMSAEINAKKAKLEEASKLTEAIVPIKKRAPRKKKVVETVANSTVNS